MTKQSKEEFIKSTTAVLHSYVYSQVVGFETTCKSNKAQEVTAVVERLNVSGQEISLRPDRKQAASCIFHFACFTTFASLALSKSNVKCPKARVY